MPTVSQLFISTGDGSVHRHKSSASASGIIYQDCDLRSQTDLRPLTSSARGRHAVIPDCTLNSAASPYFKLNSQPACFLPSTMTNSLWDGLIGLQPAQVICVCATAKHPQLDRAFWHLCRLRAPRVCLSLSEWVSAAELLCRLATWAGLQFSLGISLFCSREDTSEIALLDEPLTEQKAASWETRRSDVTPCVVHHDGRQCLEIHK